MSSITRLSSEDLLRIFTHNRQQDPKYPFDPVGTIMACSQVCRRWRRIVFLTPMLWNMCIDLSKSSQILNHVIALSRETVLGPIVFPSITPLILNSASVRSAIRRKREVPIVEILLSNAVNEPHFAKKFMSLFTLMPRMTCLILKMPHHGWMMLDLLFSLPVSHIETLVLARDVIDFDADRRSSTVLTLENALKRATGPWRLKKLFLRGCSVDLRGSRALVEIEDLTLQHLPHCTAWSIANLLAILKNTPKLLKLDLRNCSQILQLPDPRRDLRNDANANAGHNSNISVMVTPSPTQPAGPACQEGAVRYSAIQPSHSPHKAHNGTATLMPANPPTPALGNSRKRKEKFDEPMPPPPNLKQKQLGPMLPTPPSSTPLPVPQINVPPPPNEPTTLPHLTSLFLQGPVGHVCDILRSVIIPVGCNVSLHSSNIVSFLVHNLEDPANQILQAMAWRFEARSRTMVMYENVHPWTSMVVFVHAGGLQMRVFDSNNDRGAAMALVQNSTQMKPPIQPHRHPQSPSLFELTFEWNEVLSRPFADAPQIGLRVDPFLFFKKLTEHIGEATRDVTFLHFEYAFFPPFSDPQNVTHTEVLLTFLKHFEMVKWMDRITTNTFEFLLPYFMHPFREYRVASSSGSGPRASAESSTGPTSRTPTPTLDKDGNIILPDPLKSLTSIRFYKMDFSKKPFAYPSFRLDFAEVLLLFVVKRLDQNSSPRIANIIFEECTGVRPQHLDQLGSFGVVVGRYNTPGGQKF